MFILGIALAVLGLLFVMVEFFLPGGLLAVLGCLVLVGSIALIAMTLAIGWLLAFVLGLVLLVMTACRIALHLVKKSGKGDSFYLRTSQEGFQVLGYDSSLFNRTGAAVTDLKPSGYVMIDGEQFQAVSSAGYLSQGTKITVVKVEGTRLIVK